MIRRIRLWLLALAVLPTLPLTAALAVDRPVVVELFTSEGCSSCPPADALLTQLARTRPDVIALGYHVTYWDHLGWRDPFSLQAATDRQSTYASRRRDTTVFTPELVVDGAESVVGSEEAKVEAAIGRARGRNAAAASLRASVNGAGLAIEVGQGQGAAAVVLVGYDPQHTTAVARGENRGRTLLDSNVVRSVRTIGSWNGAALRLQVPRPDGERAVVLLQTSTGAIVGPVRLAPT